MHKAYPNLKVGDKVKVYPDRVGHYFTSDRVYTVIGVLASRRCGLEVYITEVPDSGFDYTRFYPVKTYKQRNLPEWW